MKKKKDNDASFTEGNNFQNRIEEHLGNQLLAISNFINLLDHVGVTADFVEIKNDSLCALHYGLRKSLKDHRLAINILDNNYCRRNGFN